jgi:hypothetical protein
VESPEKIMIKSYICLLDWVDPGHAINSASHAGTIIMLKWSDDPIVKEWTENSIRKVTCSVTEKEFTHLKQFDDYQVITELAFEGKEVGLVFKPRREWPKYFKFLRLWGRDMKGSYLTQNVVFFVDCKNAKCNKRDHAKVGIFDVLGSGEPLCSNCGEPMEFRDECIIKN